MEGHLERAATSPWRPRDPRAMLSAAVAVARARIAFRDCQQVGARVRLYGRCWVRNGGTIVIGDRLQMFGGTVRCELSTHAGGRLEIGNSVFINYGSSISAHTLVRIGRGCQIGQYAIILDCDYHTPGGLGVHEPGHPVIIGERVWLAARVTILGGVRIGDGSVIGAGSVVTGDIPPGVLAAGAPARVVRRLGQVGVPAPGSVPAPV